MTCASSDRVLGVASGLALGLLLAPAPAAPQSSVPPTPPGGKTHVMEVMGVTVDQPSGQPLVILRSREDRRELTIVIGPAEAQGIALPLQGQRLPRPYTHDLITAMLRQLGAAVVKVVISDLRDNTFFATITLRAREREIELDSRPSDAIAIALRENVPILADERVFRTPAPPAGPQEGPSR